MEGMVKRLTAQDAQRVLRRGARYASSSFSLRIMPNNEGHTRVTVVVSAKVAKKATQRNYRKRVLRHALRETLPRGASYDIALIAHPGVAQKSFTELTGELVELLKKAKVRSSA